MYLPENDTEAALAQAAMSLLFGANPVHFRDGDQDRLEAAGKQVLSGWPLPLLGYQYQFRLLQSRVPNAFAVPGGRVFVTTALYEAVETGQELEAVLAHEIAHIERRHSLRTFHAAMAQQAAQAFWAGMGAGIAAGLSSRGNYGGATAAVGVAVLGMGVMNALFSGHVKDFEREADALAMLYFDANAKDRSHIRRFFQKLSFRHLVFYDDPNPASWTHPYLSERMHRVEGTRCSEINRKFWTVNKWRKTPVTLWLIHESVFAKTSTLHVYIDDYDWYRLLMEEQGEESEAVELFADDGEKHTFTLRRGEEVRDTWGVHLWFERSWKEVASSLLTPPGSVKFRVSVEVSGLGLRKTDFVLDPS